MKKEYMVMATLVIALMLGVVSAIPRTNAAIGAYTSDPAVAFPPFLNVPVYAPPAYPVPAPIRVVAVVDAGLLPAAGILGAGGVPIWGMAPAAWPAGTFFPGWPAIGADTYSIANGDPSGLGPPLLAAGTYALWVACPGLAPWLFQFAVATFLVIPEMPLGTVAALSISIVGIALLWLRRRETTPLTITP